MPGAVVLGMHRSGTSAVTRILNLMGADVGPEADLITEYDNPAGHWESKTLTACNDRILDAFGRSWDFPPRLRAGWEYSSRATGLLPELAEAFRGVFRGDLWVWKDPRTCLTFPLWRRVLGSEARVVLVFREPAAVVASVARRDGIPRPYSTGLWHRYVRASLEAARGMPTVCVHFEDLVARPDVVTEALAADLRALGVALPGTPQNAVTSLRRDLVHDAPPGALLRATTSSLVAALRRLPPSTASFDPPPGREPPWVAPLLGAYRGPWVVRSRLGHPLRPRGEPLGTRPEGP
ncbi:MAG TPA: sulfotransferase [Acidimicrobiales bacterium]|nr:sulfotransferase [Acidimicrobiales bacterium]